ncbi:hypothetical protein [Micromonospora sp. 067-2]|uniref:hypothetical protein n=1 Tax=Micromonospora sp. 067-2 TaxID=2789270 RepID=UPI0039792EDA
MNHRRRDGRTRLALWMLVALGDAVLLLISAGASVLIALLAVVTVAVGGVGAWKLIRRGTQVHEDARPTSAMVPVAGRVGTDA